MVSNQPCFSVVEATLPLQSRAKTSCRATSVSCFSYPPPVSSRQESGLLSTPEMVKAKNENLVFWTGCTGWYIVNLVNKYFCSRRIRVIAGKIMDSHIQLPNFILKNFRDQTGRVYYLRTSDMHIGLTGTKRIGAKPDYFSEYGEEILSGYIEAPFSKVARAVIQNGGSLTNSGLSVGEAENTLKRYVDALLLRSDLAQKIFRENSYTAGMCSDQMNHDGLAMVAVDENADMPFTKDTFMLILSNDAGTEFVVPRNGFYFISMSSVCTWIVPVSPKCAFALRPKV